MVTEGGSEMVRPAMMEKSAKYSLRLITTGRILSLRSVVEAATSRDATIELTDCCVASPAASTRGFFTDSDKQLFKTKSKTLPPLSTNPLAPPVPEHDAVTPTPEVAFDSVPHCHCQTDEPVRLQVLFANGVLVTSSVDD